MNNKTLKILNRIYRGNDTSPDVGKQTLKILNRMYRGNDTSPDVMILFEIRYIKSIFCINCGNYVIRYPKSHNRDCFCDTRQTYFLIYKSFIEKFSDCYGGHVIDDYIESQEGAHPDLVKYIFKLILFGEIYQKPFFYMIDDFISDNIISFFV